MANNSRDFYINQSTCIQVLETYKEMETVLEAERENLSDGVNRIPMGWNGAAARTTQKAVETLLNEGVYDRSCRAVSAMCRCLEDALPRINTLLVRSQGFPDQLRNDDYVEPPALSWADNCIRNGGILSLNYGQAAFIYSTCNDIVEQTDMVVDKLTGILEDCGDLLDGSGAALEGIQAASRKLHRVENYRQSFELFVNGIRDLESDMRVQLRAIREPEEAGRGVQDVSGSRQDKEAAWPDIDSLTDMEVVEKFESIPNYNVFLRRIFREKHEAYDYKQMLAVRYYGIKLEEGRQLAEQYGILDDLQYIYGNLPYIDGPELEEWNRKQVEAFERYKCLQDRGVDFTWIEAYYQKHKQEVGLEKTRADVKGNEPESSAGSVLYKAVGAVPAGIYTLGSYVTGSPIDENSAWYYPTRMSQTIRGTVETEIEDSFLGETGKIIYRTGMGVADFSTAQFVTSGNGAVLMGVEGYAETGMAGVSRGLSPDAIQVEALVAGLGDLAMGAVFGKAGEANLWRNLLEAAETGAISSIVNSFADITWAGDKSYIAGEYREYLEAGMDEEQAVLQVALTELGKLGEEVVQSVATAGTLHGVAKIKSKIGEQLGYTDTSAPMDDGTDTLQDAGGDGKINADGEMQADDSRDSINAIQGIGESCTETVAYHSVGGDNSAKKIQSVLDGIDISYTSPESRFGQGFYVAADGNTTVAELAYHGVDAKYSIRYNMNLEGQKVLDLTNPKVASEWRFLQGESSLLECHNIAEIALDEGYNVIKVQSYRDAGINYVIYNNFDEILQPQMVTPIGD